VDQIRTRMMVVVNTIDTKSSRQYTSGMERFLARVWTQVLGVPCVDSSDSFVALGGDSLTALKIVNEILRVIREEYEQLPPSACTNPILVKAVAESQTFGEIQGAFSVVALLEAPSLGTYSKMLDPLVEGLKAFEIDEESQLEKDDVDLDDPDPALTKAIMDASSLGMVETIRSILNLGIVNADGRFVPRKRMCRSPLHNAALASQPKAIRVLIEEFGARTLAVASNRVSPLHLAAAPSSTIERADDARQSLWLLMQHTRKQRENVRPLLVEDKNQQTPLHYAARAGRCDLIQTLLDEQRQAESIDSSKFGLKNGIVHAVNLFDRWRRTPLHWAVVNLHLDAAKLLVQEGAQVVRDGLRIGRPGPHTNLLQETVLQMALRRNAPQELIEFLKRAEQAENETSQEKR